MHCTYFGHTCTGFSGVNCEMSNETVSSTVSPTTEAVTTASPTTEAVTTVVDTTVAATTLAPSTEPVTTELLTTAQAPSNTTCEDTNSCDGGHYVCDPQTNEKMCLIGFNGTDCKEKDVIKDDPECPSHVQCKNGGTCWNNTCCCAKGYDGVSCQYDIDECVVVHHVSMEEYAKMKLGTTGVSVLKVCYFVTFYTLLCIFEHIYLSGWAVFSVFLNLIMVDILV